VKQFIYTAVDVVNLKAVVIVGVQSEISKPISYRNFEYFAAHTTSLR